MEDVGTWYRWKSGLERLVGYIEWSACGFEGLIGPLCDFGFEDWWVVLCCGGNVILWSSVGR